MAGKDRKSNKYVHDERNADRLRRTVSPEAMGVELVSALAGDRDLTKAENTLFSAQKEQRGNVFFTDLLYIISHHYFAPQIAESLWNKVLSHKQIMIEQLRRKVHITVAALDYFSTIDDELKSLTLIPEAYVLELANLSMRDGMTGLFNHTSCYELLRLEFRNYQRYADGLSLILLDIDDFKLVNDRCGHQEGDRILIELAKIMLEQVRDSDICCRFGGEEFIVILPFTNDSAEACRIGERIREKSMNITIGDQRITIIAGVSSCDQSIISPEALIEKADQALYKAKQSGKNQVVMGVINGGN